jgi:hypothetical protein
VVVIALFFAFAVFSLQAQEVKVSGEIDQEKAYENHPLKGTITITHDENLKVDTRSFLLEGSPLSVELIREVKISPNNPLIISIYRFEIPGQPKGLHVLPEISVSVGGKVYRSPASTYTVEGIMPRRGGPTTPAQPSIEATLRLEALVEGKMPLYPGQRVRLVYRYYYTGDIGLTEEELPLLDAKGFLKIGEKEIKDYSEGEKSVREISQEVEAVTPGEFSFGPSIIEGYGYQEDAFGKRTYSTAKLRSEASPVTVIVRPFPNEGKPASFNGAVGKFTFKVALLTPHEMKVGDDISLAVDIGGKNILEVPLPEICCQPGFSGFFQPSDLPPIGKIQDGVKRFVVQLKPLSDAIKEIPSIEFSSFDPESSKYIVLHSEPIPITVHPSKIPRIEDLDKQQRPASAPTKKEKTAISQKPEAIEIEGNFLLQPEDLHNKIFGNWWALAIIPAGIALLIYQKNMQKDLRRKRSEVKPKSSADLFEEAFRQHPGSSSFYNLLNQAFKLKLVEIGEIASPDVAAENLPQTGLSKEVRAFLCGIEEKRFTGQGDLSPQTLHKQAQDLLERMQRTHKEEK